MNDIDKMIRDALSAEDHDLLADLGDEPTILQMVADTFRGRMKWVVVLVYVATTTFFLLGIFSAVRFLSAETERDLIRWGVALMCCLVVVYAPKIWYWMELNKNTVMREVKRVELQIARLAAEVRKDRG